MKHINDILDRLPTAIDTADLEAKAEDATLNFQPKWLSNTPAPNVMMGDESLYYIL